MKKKKCKNKLETINLRLDYHEGLSENQVKIFLLMLGLKADDFFEWMSGQTCPIIERRSKETGDLITVGGYYEYDIFRWIESKQDGTLLVWD